MFPAKHMYLTIHCHISQDGGTQLCFGLGTTLQAGRSLFRFAILT